VKQIIATAKYDGRKYEIKYGGEGVGFYLFVFSGDQCTNDYLQETLELTKQFAFEEFGVPPEAWQPSK
jgi:hypothetical protein